MNVDREANKIVMENVEIEQKPGAGVTTLKSLADYAEEAKGGGGLAGEVSKAKKQESISQLFLTNLLKPREWSAQTDGSGYLPFRREHVLALAEECQKTLSEQSIVLHVDAPIKVFGDIHGQY